MLRDLEIRLPTNWVNGLNFLFLDGIFIALVFHLSAEVIGRLSVSTLTDSKPRLPAFPLEVIGRSCMAHCPRTHLLLLARIIALGLVLLTNLTVKETTEIDLIRVNQTVLARGNISHFTRTQFEEAMLVRTSCQGSRPPSSSGVEGKGGVTYYGELRGPVFGECITEPSLISGTLVEFGSEILLRNLSTGSPCRRVQRTKRDLTVAEFICPKATLSCVMIGQMVLYWSCRGLVEHENEIYLCEEGAARPDMALEPTHAHWVRGIELRFTEWLDGIFISTASLKDVIDATFGANSEHREVLVERGVQWTRISPIWLVFLVLKVLLVAALGYDVILLKLNGYFPILNVKKHPEKLPNACAEDHAFSGQRQQKVSTLNHAAETTDRLFVCGNTRTQYYGSTASPAKDVD